MCKIGKYMIGAYVMYTQYSNNMIIQENLGSTRI